MAKSPPPPICTLRGHEGVITTLCFTNEECSGLISSPTLISGSDIGEMFFWNLKTYRSYHKIKGHNGMILYNCFYKSTLLSQGREGLINLWKFTDGQWIVSRTLQCSNYGFCTAQLLTSPSITYLIAPTGQGTSLTLYNYETLDIVHNLIYKTPPDAKNNLGMCMCIKAVKESNIFYILMGFDGGRIAIWDFTTKTVMSELKCHPEVVFCLDYDFKHKNRGISGSSDDVLQTWTMKDSKLMKGVTVKITNPGVCSVQIRDDGKIVVSAGQDGAIRIFSWKNLKPLAVLNFHVEQVNILSFFMDNLCDYKSIFASGSKDKNICLWSIY